MLEELGSRNSTESWLWRAFDYVGAGLGVLFFCPVFALVSLGIFLTDGAPLFFQQERVGKNGKTFMLFKFRTMAHGSEDENGVTVHEDDRVTRIGTVLRKLKLDELPQLINVLRGEMSLVGPRPDVVSVIETLPEDARAVLRYRPGVTSQTTLIFGGEMELLAEAADPSRYYVEVLAPLKAREAASEMSGATLGHYFNAIFSTLSSGPKPAVLRELVESQSTTPAQWSVRV
jgi:lipopolysaccharide/colanic/teichoic acid biosynthesis glycosyltransferase